MNIELAVNLWAIYDASSGCIYGLSGRAYGLVGSDSEKLSVLRSLSATDYISAKRYEVPSRFSIINSDGTKSSGFTYPSTIHDPDAMLFDEMFENLDSELPPIPDFSKDSYQPVTQKLPKNPLSVITILYEDEQGHIRPIITDEDRAWVLEHDKKFQLR